MPDEKDPPTQTHVWERESLRDDANDPYPGYFVSGIDDEGREILSPATPKEVQP